MTDPPWILSTESYRTITGANSQSPVLRWFLNSMIAATANAPLILVTASMAAYALARMSFRGKNIMFAVIIATLFTPRSCSSCRTPC